MRARISEGMSKAMKMRMSHQFATDHVQRLLRGPLANTIAIAKKLSFQHFSLAAIGQGRVDEANGLLLSAAARAGDSGNAHSQSRLAAFPDALRQRRCYFAAHSSMLLDQQRGHAGQGGLQRVVIDHSAA